MSRSGYNDNCYDWALICWRGAVASAMRGKRGQALLREMAEALDAMPAKRIISDYLVRDGEACALGVLAMRRGMYVAELDPDDREAVAAAFGVAPALVAEIAYENDEGDPYGLETPERRWVRMREWVANAIQAQQP